MHKSPNSVALVTGGSSGIGKSIAIKLSSGNHKVIVADIEPYDKVDDNMIYRNCDVTKGNDVDELYAWASQNTGLPDVLVLNAGRGIHEKLTEGDPEKWKDILDLNIMGVLRCIRAFVPAMVEKKKGHVVFISSVAATKPYTYGAVYSASKAAIEIIAETLRLETLPDVKVTIVAAGVTDTNFFANQVSGNTNIQEMGMGSLSADDVAEDVFYAISKKGGAGINKIITRPGKQDF